MLLSSLEYTARTMQLFRRMCFNAQISIMLFSLEKFHYTEHTAERPTKSVQIPGRTGVDTQSNADTGISSGLPKQ